MAYENIGVEAGNRLATLTLKRPDIGNAITDGGMIEEFVQAVTSLDAAGDVSVLIISGSGGIFCAGGNVQAMRKRSGIFAGTPAQLCENVRRSVQRISKVMAAVEMVTIAAVNGAAVGAGCDLALMCDLRIASEKARFSQAFISLGLIPGDGGAWFLSRMVGRQVAADMIFTGRMVGAEEAEKLGLVREVVADDELEEKARELASVIAAKPPEALRTAKRLLKAAAEMPLAEYLDLCASSQALLQCSEDHREALAAFFEKRPGNFQGR